MSQIKVDKLESKMTSYHICVRVDKAIELLKEGTNLFEPATVTQVWHALNDRKKKGYEYITGCNNEDKTGRCNGHKPKPPTVMEKLVGPERELKKVKNIEKQIVDSGKCPSCTAGLGPHRNCILR